jgi:hypothetical protein
VSLITKSEFAAGLSESAEASPLKESVSLVIKYQTAPGCCPLACPLRPLRLSLEDFLFIQEAPLCKEEISSKGQLTKKPFVVVAIFCIFHEIKQTSCSRMCEI